MKSTLRLGMALFAAVAAFSFVACSSMSDNEGSTLTTKDGEQITEAMIVGKWDLDGERTNTANGNAGVGAIPDDVVKDVFGAGWRIQPNGVMQTDKTVGSDVGAWKIEGKNTLIVQENKAANSPEVRYEASFRDGFMYLKKSDGKYAVMEKSKFFGF